MSQQPQPPAGWGAPPPPRPPKASGLPWYQRWWWAVALAAFLLGVAFAGRASQNPSQRSGRSPRCRSVRCGRRSARRSPTNLSGDNAKASWPATTGRCSRQPPRRLLLRRPRRGDPGPRRPRLAGHGRRPPSRRRRTVTRPIPTSASRRRRQTWTALTSAAATSRSGHPTRTGSTVTAMEWAARAREGHCLPGIRFSVGCAVIIHLIIQTILLYPSGAVWTDEASNVSRPGPSGAIPTDAEHPTRNRKVVGWNPTSGSKTAGQRAFLASLTARWRQAVIPSGQGAVGGPRQTPARSDGR